MIIPKEYTQKRLMEVARKVPKPARFRLGAAVVSRLQKRDPYSVALNRESPLIPRSARTRLFHPRIEISPTVSFLPHQLGGQRPKAANSARSSVLSETFIDSNQTVARPIGVKPMIRSFSVMKCWSHRCVRGLNIRANFPVSGSIVVRLVPLQKLQR